jgi:hypothetical protein
MKRIFLTCFSAALLLAACNNDKTEDKTAGTSEVKETTKPDPCAGYVKDSTMKEPPMDSAMMANWMAAAAPGPMHAMLAKDDGAWEGEVTSWMDPAAPPTKSKTSSTNRMVMGGRYQLSEHSGCFGGMPFEGMSIVGYDNMKKVFMSSWIDNMGTTIMNMEGTMDSASRTMHFSGSCTNPMTGKQQNVKQDLTFIDDNTQKMTMWGPDMTGKDYKTMEIVMKRKK